MMDVLSSATIFMPENNVRMAVATFAFIASSSVYYVWFWPRAGGKKKKRTTTTTTTATTTTMEDGHLKTE